MQHNKKGTDKMAFTPNYLLRQTTKTSKKATSLVCIYRHHLYVLYV